MLELIGGFPGSGKSRLLYSKINETVKGGNSALLIVPEQQLVFAEHRLADILAPNEMMKADALSFRRLANSVFRIYGGLACNYPGKGADILLMQRALVSVLPSLRLYKNVSPSDMRTVKKLIEARKNFSVNGISPAELSDICDGMNNKDRLYDKLYDLSLIMSAYDIILKKSFDDPNDDLTRLCELPQIGGYFSGKYIFIDSFNSFTKQEYNVIALMMRYARGVCIAINYTENDNRASATKTNECVKILKRLALSSGDHELNTIFTDYKKGREDLDTLTKGMFSDRHEKYTAVPENIRLFSASDPIAETDYVFRDILSYIKNGGRFKDCLICSPDIASYSGIISGMGERYGIPVFTSGRYSMNGRSAVRAIRSVIRIAIENFSLDSILEYMKSRFSCLTPDICDIVEDYIMTWGICGRKQWKNEWTCDPAGRGERASGKDMLPFLNEQRQKLYSSLEEITTTISKECSCSEKLVALTSFLMDTKMPEKLEELAMMAEESGDILSASYHRATWQGICDFLDTLYSVFSDVVCDGESFLRYIDTVTESADLGIIPTSSDEVLTGDLLLIRPESPKRVYIIGMSDKHFPSGETGGLFSDDDIERLESYDIKIGDNTEKKLYNDYFSLYCVSCVARESLFIGYSSSTPTGESVSGSSVLREFRSLFPSLESLKISQYTLSELEYLRDNSELISVFRYNDRISEELTDRIFKEGIQLSQSKLETYAMCPFSYFYKYVIKIREEKTPGFASNLIGTVLHAVFEEFMKSADSLGKSITELTDDECNEIIERVTLSVMKESDVDEEDMRSANLFRRIKHTAFLILRDMSGEFRKSSFRPVGYEVPVGNTGEGNPIPSPLFKLEDGTEISIRGVIDRVDTFKGKDGKVYVKITDYKTYDKNVALEDLDNGVNLQMFLYMIAICESPENSFDSHFGREKGDKYLPAAIFYHISKRPENGKGTSRNGFIVNDSEIIDALGRGSGRKVLDVSGSQKAVDEAFFGAMLEKTKDSVKHSAQGMKSGNCAVAPLKTSHEDGCKYCKFRPICRISAGNEPDDTND